MMALLGQKEKSAAKLTGPEERLLKANNKQSSSTFPMPASWSAKSMSEIPSWLEVTSMSGQLGAEVDEQHMMRLTAGSEYWRPLCR